MKSVAFSTLGCKANYTDTEEMIASCRAAGLRIVSFEEEADAYVVNTCTVTATADRQSRQMIRRPMKARPGAVVVAVGCAVEVGRDSVGGIGADAVFGAKERGEALSYIFGRLGISTGVREAGGARAFPPQSRARAFLKIQDGCDRRCAYCIVPAARGKAESMPAAEVEEACLLLSKSHREIVLTGIDIGQYGRGAATGRVRAEGKATPGLVDLLCRLARVEGMPRLRFSSVDPSLITDRLVELLACSDRICRHVHLSIQSASPGVLRRMGRGYGKEEIRRAAGVLKERVPGVAVTGDLIAGFPGETEDEHRETVRLVEEIWPAGLHVFPYSARAGTPAAAMPGQVPAAVRKERARELRDVAARCRKKFLEGQVGSRVRAVVTSREVRAGGLASAFTDNAMAVCVPAGGISYGEEGTLLITDVRNLEVFGKWE